MERQPASLSIPDHLLGAIDAHAVACYPDECCGALIGRSGRVSSIWPTRNSWEGDRAVRFEIAPVDLVEIQKAARQQGREILGYYHSHPDRPAAPSARDRAAAWPGLSYLILAVSADGVRERRSWRYHWRHATFVEERLDRGAGDRQRAEP